MRIMGSRLVDDETYEAYVLLGVRALLRNGKGKAIMKVLKSEDVAAYELIMIEAWRRYSALPIECREESNRGLATLLHETERLQNKMIEKAKEAGVFDVAHDNANDRDKG
jgi:hypothetical protein